MNVLDVFATVDTIAGQARAIWSASASPARAASAIRPRSNFRLSASMARQIVVAESGSRNMDARSSRRARFDGGAGGFFADASSLLPGPVDGNVTQIKYILPNIADIQRTCAASRNRNRDQEPSDRHLCRTELSARTRLLRAKIWPARSFQTRRFVNGIGDDRRNSRDVSGDMARIAEAVTANGSTLRDYNFVPNGLMSRETDQFQSDRRGHSS